MSATTRCPRCEGLGWIGPVHFNYGDGRGEWKDRVDCDVCRGSGAIGADQKAAIDMGDALRSKRMDRDESLREAAKRLNLKPAELSALERGVGGMAAWHHPFAASAYLEATARSEPNRETGQPVERSET